MSCPCGLRMVIPLVKSTSGGPNFGDRLGASGYHHAGRLLDCGGLCLLCLWWQWSLFVG